jgi:hypothetical protein
MDRDELIKQIKHNCNISDAKFWGYYSICGLLLRYRELYRNEHSLMPWDVIPPDGITFWINEREALWKGLENEEFCPLIIDGIQYDPFDVNGLNSHLKGSGLVCGGGYSTYGKPSFFLARLDDRKELYDYIIYYTGNELCRELSASPAMLQGRCIYIRFDVLRAILWEKFQELNARKYGGLLEEIFSCYGIGRNNAELEKICKKINDIACDASQLLIMHEVGEAFEDDHSEEWFKILHSGIDKFSELYLRAAKDLLADTSEMGPLKTIMNHKNKSLLNFFMVFMDGIRKEIFPEIRNAFQEFVESDSWPAIENARLTGYRRAVEMRDMILRSWREHGNTAGLANALKQYIKDAFTK